MGRKLGLDVAQRYEVVMTLLRREEPAAVIARRYGICEATLYQPPGSLGDRLARRGRPALPQELPLPADSLTDRESRPGMHLFQRRGICKSLRHVIEGPLLIGGHRSGSALGVGLNAFLPSLALPRDRAGGQAFTVLSPTCTAQPKTLHIWEDR